MKLWICHSPAFKFNGSARWCAKIKGDMILTGTVSVLVSKYCPTLQSVLSRSSCLLRPRQGTADFSRSPQVRRPARVFFSSQPGGSACLTPSRISHNLPGVATRTSTPRSSIRPCFCVDIPPTIAAMLTGGGARGIDSPFSFPL
jgi:hypothetical protein